MTEENAKQIAGGNRWKIEVELTFDVLPEDCEEKFEGDELVDFQRRAFERVRPSLNELVGEDKPFAHFHILKTAEGCHDF